MNLIEKAHIKLSFVDQYLSFIIGGVKLQETNVPITHFGTEFSMAIMYEATNQEFILLYNLKNIEKEKWGVPEVVALLQHEMGHILCNHFGRQEDRDPLRWNVAGDFTLDQYIPNIPRPQEVLDMIKEKYPNNTAEEIYYKLPKNMAAPKTIFIIVNNGSGNCPQCDGSGKEKCPTCKGKGTIKCESCSGSGCNKCENAGKQECPDCNGTGKGEGDCPLCGGSGTVQNIPILLPQDEVGNAIGKLVKETTGKELQEVAAEHGHKAGIWAAVRQALVSEEIDWREIPKYLASFRDKKTRTLKKPSKRFPTPWGNRKEYRPKLTVAVDCSGSIDNIELNAFIAEVDRLTMITGEIHLVFSDCFVQKTIDKYKAHQGFGDIPGRGGTDYDPALTYIEQTWPDTDLIVYLTDGECHPPQKKYRKPVIWIVTRNFGLGVSPMIKAPTLSKRG